MSLNVNLVLHLICLHVGNIYCSVDRNSRSQRLDSLSTKNVHRPHHRYVPGEEDTAPSTLWAEHEQLVIPNNRCSRFIESVSKCVCIWEVGNSLPESESMSDVEAVIKD